MSLGSAIKEALWYRHLLSDLGFAERSILILGDNQGALKLLTNNITGGRSKHIDVVYHFARERVQRGQVQVEYMPTQRMVADALTKAVPRDKLHWCREAMGVF